MEKHNYLTHFIYCLHSAQVKLTLDLNKWHYFAWRIYETVCVYTGRSQVVRIGWPSHTSDSAGMMLPQVSGYVHIRSRLNLVAFYIFSIISYCQIFVIVGVFYCGNKISLLKCLCLFELIIFDLVNVYFVVL